MVTTKRRRRRPGSKEGSYVRLMDGCITQLESNKEEERRCRPGVASPIRYGKH